MLGAQLVTILTARFLLRVQVRRTAPRAFRVQSYERQRPPSAYRGGLAMAAKRRTSVRRSTPSWTFDPLVYGSGIAIKNMKGDVANNGTVRPRSRRKAAIRPAGPTRRTGRCPR
jgi:hypothetical protein